MSTEITDHSPAKEIFPILHPLDAIVHVPGSKSLTNRALLIASLAKGRTKIAHGLFSDDAGYFTESLKTLGFRIDSDATLSTYAVNGLSGIIPANHANLYVGNAGTAARFLTAMLTLGEGKYTVDGDARMRQRPIRDLLDTLAQLGAKVEGTNGCLPVEVTGSGLPGGCGTVSGNASSQFLSGLLMIAPFARNPIEISVKGGLNSRPYIDMTLAVMADFGVEIERNGYERFVIQPSSYNAKEFYTIESDASAASYFFAAPAILGGKVCVKDISLDSKQGDLAFLGILEKMGCKLRTGEDFIEVTGASELKGIEVDMRDISDTTQTLAVIAPFANSPTIVHGIDFIRAKETDRISAVCTELNRLGVKVEEKSDGMIIHPTNKINPAHIHTYNDHRMAMAFSLIGLRAGGICIENPSCVSKTFPNYFEVLEALR
jgi:3-phosphoshikimate 1-carboxyvinyltransferase